jgi:antitoxin component YwqK of YwqJK toxin-antitoxin module
MNQNVTRILAGSATAVVMSVLITGMFSFIPQHEPKLFPNGPKKSPIADGIWEQKDFMGLIETQWSMDRGVAEGTALQFYSNGSLFRELNYRRGKIDGEVREYFDKPRFMQRPTLGRVATEAERARAAGAIRKIVYYEGGVLNGPYQIFKPDGTTRETGTYHDGRKEVHR